MAAITKRTAEDVVADAMDGSPALNTVLLLDLIEQYAKEKADFALCQLSEIRALVDKQANDGGLWYITENASTAYIQQEFRKLHALIEKHITSIGEK